MTLVLTSLIADGIRAEGTKNYPHECCGLLLGTLNGSQKRAEVLWTVENVWTDEIPLTETESDHSLRDRFYIPPKAYLLADRAARARNLELVGCYHSHPDDRAKLSERDRIGAAGAGGGPDFSFVVVSVRDSNPGEMTTALLSTDGQHWLLEELVIEE